MSTNYEIYQFKEDFQHPDFKKYVTFYKRMSVKIDITFIKKNPNAFNPSSSGNPQNEREKYSKSSFPETY